MKQVRISDHAVLFEADALAEPATVKRALLVSSVRVETGTGHDRVTVFVRGENTGQLFVNAGDGAAIALRLLYAPPASGGMVAPVAGDADRVRTVRPPDQQACETTGCQRTRRHLGPCYFGQGDDS